MSYDIEVHGRVALSPPQMLDLGSAHGLTVDGDYRTAAPTVLSLQSSTNGTYAFTLSGPYAIDADDLPTGRRVDLANATQLYRIVVESGGTSPGDAVSFARHLADRVVGRVVDPQTRDRPRQATGAGAEKQSGVSDRYLHIEWYFHSDGESISLPRLYVSAARESLSQALPTRFGTHHPYSGRLSQEEDGGLTAFYREECALNRLIFKGSGPLLDGHFPEWSRNVRQSISLTFDFASPDTLPPSEIERFFVAVARQTGSFFGCAEVNEHRILTSVPSSASGRWPGLPRVPQWLTWFSPEYADLVDPYLTPRGRRSFAEGVVHRWTDTPSSADEILPLLSRRRWAPEKLLAQQRDPDRPRIATSEARVMPVSLGGTERSGRTF